MKVCLRDTAGSPERARWLHLARSGSQSQRAIWFILPVHGASYIIKIAYLPTVSAYTGSTVLDCRKLRRKYIDELHEFSNYDSSRDERFWTINRQENWGEFERSVSLLFTQYCKQMLQRWIQTWRNDLNKIFVKKKKHITLGWEFSSHLYRVGKGRKKEKTYIVFKREEKKKKGKVITARSI